MAPHKIPGVPLTPLSPAERITSFLSFASGPEYGGHDKALVTQHLRVVSADSNGRATFAFHCAREFTNRMGNLHGGAAALLLDVCTTCALALVAKPGFWETAGITRKLDLSYYRPVPCGEDVRVTCEVVQAGRRMATIRGSVLLGDGRVACTVEHLKCEIEARGKL